MIADLVSYETIAITMFATMLLMLLTGQRVFGVIGFVAAMAALLLWGEGAVEMPYTAAWKLFKWYPMLTLPLFIYMGYMISESGIADDLYKMFHVYFGGIKGGLAIGTMGMMVAIGELQKHLGPDTRVSATADILDERIESGSKFETQFYTETSSSSLSSTVSKNQAIDLNENGKTEFNNSVEAVIKLWDAASKIDPDLNKD